MKILIIDTYNMIHRARHSFIKGENATIFNFFRSLKSEIVKHDVDKVYVVGEGRPSHRLMLNSDYKGNRVRTKDENFHRQKREILELCRRLPITWMRHVDYECDDVIGHLCRTLDPSNQIVIVSTDTDFIQLLELHNVKLWNPIKKRFIDKWPVDYVCWKALKGDSSDNVPGIKGIGEKRAHMLMESFDTLNAFLDEDPHRREVYELAYDQIVLANIAIDSLGWESETCKFDESFIHETFTRYGFKTIIGKSWIGWKQAMERLENVDTQQTVN